MSAAVIRRAELADAEQLGALHSGCYGELYPGVLSPEILAELSPAMMTQLWTKFVSRGEPYVQFVAEVEGTIVGFIGVGPGREPGYEEATELYFIFVHPAARRMGIGRQLLRTADPHYTWLWSSNRDAQMFYKKAKFYPDSVAREGAIFGTAIEELRFAG